MNGNSFKKPFLHKNRLFGWLGVLLFIFTVADTTILQYYNGNEALGIPFYNLTTATAANQITASSRKKDSNEFTAQTPAPPTPDDHSQLPAGCDECICSCAHVLTGSYFVERFDAVLDVFHRPISVSFPTSPHSESHLSSLFRPPRRA